MCWGLYNFVVGCVEKDECFYLIAAKPIHDLRVWSKRKSFNRVCDPHDSWPDLITMNHCFRYLAHCFRRRLGCIKQEVYTYGKLPNPISSSLMIDSLKFSIPLSWPMARVLYKTSFLWLQCLWIIFHSLLIRLMLHLIPSFLEFISE